MQVPTHSLVSRVVLISRATLNPNFSVGLVSVIRQLVCNVLPLFYNLFVSSFLLLIYQLTINAVHGTPGIARPYAQHCFAWNDLAYLTSGTLEVTNVMCKMQLQWKQLSNDL